MSNHHDLNLGEGSPILMGEVKGILGLVINILMRFSLLKAKDATTTSRAKVESVPICLGQNQIGRQTYGNYKLKSHTHPESMPGDEREKHRQQRKVLP
nr:hypothetical protein CFP56_52032 [Quercus suber]